MKMAQKAFWYQTSFVYSKKRNFEFMVTRRFISSKEFLRKLTQGKYKDIIEYASQRENELDVQIRDNYLNIYYRGGNLLRVHPRHFYFDEFYFHRGAKDRRKTHLLKSDKTEDKELVTSYQGKRDEMLSILQNEGMAAYCVQMKGIMDKWEEDLHTIGISHDEKNEQQLISMNNRGNTDYTVIDLEYSVSTSSNFHYEGNLTKTAPRFDIIAVDKTGQLVVIELKTGLGAIQNSSGIRAHKYCFDHSIGRDQKGEFMQEMIDLLDQKKSFHLIDENVQIDKDKKPQFLFAFSEKVPGENLYEEFVKACRAINYTDKIIYLDNEHKLK